MSNISEIFSICFLTVCPVYISYSNIVNCIRTTPLNPINVQSYRVNVLVLFMMTNLQLDNVTVLLPLYLNDYSSKSIILRHFIFGILIRTCIIIT